MPALAMLSLRRHRFVRLFITLLLVWLTADTLSHGTCSHDPVLFSLYGHSQLDGGSKSHRPSDDGDVNHCACHWHFLPASVSDVVTVGADTPVVCASPAWVPGIIARSLERPPRRFA
jgi:hypothetical protein